MAVLEIFSIFSGKTLMLRQINNEKIAWTAFSEENIPPLNKFLIFQNKLILGSSNHVI